MTETGTDGPPSSDDVGEDESVDDRIAPLRRDYIKLTAAGAAAIGVVAGGDLLRSEETKTLLYGYGGVGIAAAATDTETESEPNDHRADADPVAVNTAVDGSLDPQEVDWYSVTTSSLVAVSFERTSGDGVAAVALYDGSGQFLNQVHVVTDGPVSIPAPAVETDRYLIEVVDVESGDGSYTFTAMAETETTTETPTETTTTTETATPTETTTETTTTATETATPTETTTESASDYGLQGYGEEGYGGVAL